MLQVQSAVERRLRERDNKVKLIIATMKPYKLEEVREALGLLLEHLEEGEPREPTTLLYLSPFRNCC